jgi:COP9 signalosome complex subunit 2
MRLEFIIINIQYLNKINEIDECERLYFEADQLNKEKIIKDNRINAIISEEAGKYYFRLEKYAQALENFKDAYKSYQDSGSSRTNVILKILVLCFILQRNDEVIIDTEESKRYPDDKLLLNMVELKEAYDKLEIKKINRIIKEKLITEETDFIIKDNINDIVRNLRINYLLKKLGLYSNIALITIEKEMELDNNTLKCLINQLCSLGSIDVIKYI